MAKGDQIVLKGELLGGMGELRHEAQTALRCVFHSGSGPGGGSRGGTCRWLQGDPGVSGVGVSHWKDWDAAHWGKKINK